MNRQYLASLALAYVLGALTVVAIYRRRGRRAMRPRHANQETGVLAFVRRHAVAFVLVSVALDVILTAALAVGVNVLHSTVDDMHATTQRLSADEATQRDQLACQRQVNNDLLHTLRQRADASRGAVLAPQEFFHALLPALVSPDATKAQGRVVLRELVKANRDANAAYQTYIQSQRDNPLPGLPDCSKGIPR